VAAEAETGKVLAELDGPRPDSVTVTAVHGFPVEELIKAGQVVQHSHSPVLIVPPEDPS
jgi:hypothetical protein